MRFCKHGTQYNELQALNTPNYANVLAIWATWLAKPWPRCLIKINVMMSMMCKNIVSSFEFYIFIICNIFKCLVVCVIIIIRIIIWSMKYIWYEVRNIIISNYYIEHALLYKSYERANVRRISYSRVKKFWWDKTVRIRGKIYAKNGSSLADTTRLVEEKTV